MSHGEANTSSKLTLVTAFGSIKPNVPLRYKASAQSGVATPHGLFEVRGVCQPFDELLFRLQRTVTAQKQAEIGEIFDMSERVIREQLEPANISGLMGSLGAHPEIKLGAYVAFARDWEGREWGTHPIHGVYRISAITPQIKSGMAVERAESGANLEMDMVNMVRLERATTSDSRRQLGEAFSVSEKLVRSVTYPASLECLGVVEGNEPVL